LYTTASTGGRREGTSTIDFGTLCPPEEDKRATDPTQVIFKQEIYIPIGI
jgi:hypothetical protein